MGDDYKWKIVMLGDFAVGKTSLVRRFVYDEFSDSYLTTIGVKVTKKELTVDNAEISMLLWDIAGSDRFSSISSEYLRGSSGGIIVADVTRPGSIENIKGHINLIKSINSKAGIVVALNKADLLKNGKEREAFMKSYGFGSGLSSVPEVFLTSARSGENVEKVFSYLAKSIMTGDSDE